MHKRDVEVKVRVLLSLTCILLHFLTTLELRIEKDLYARVAELL